MGARGDASGMEISSSASIPAGGAAQWRSADRGSSSPRRSGALLPSPHRNSNVCARRGTAKFSSAPGAAALPLQRVDPGGWRGAVAQRRPRKLFPSPRGGASALAARGDTSDMEISSSAPARGRRAEAGRAFGGAGRALRRGAGFQALSRGLHCTSPSLREGDAHVLVCVFATAIRNSLGVIHGACGAAAPPTPGPALRVRPAPCEPGRPRNSRAAAAVDEAGAGAASAAAGWHSPELTALALGLRRSSGTGRSVGFFEAKNPDITKVAVMKFRH